MSKAVTPVVVSDDGLRHDPMAQGDVFPPGAIPLSVDRQNLLESATDGLLLKGDSLVSSARDNVVGVNLDGKLYFGPSLAFDAATSKLLFYGNDKKVVSEVALPVAPGLPTIVEILQDTVPPAPDGYQQNPYERGTYLHMRFRLDGDKTQDIYIDVSKLADIYTAGPGIAVSPDKVISLNVLLKLSGNDFLLLDKDNTELAKVFMPFSDETLTTAELLVDFTPPPEHGQQTSALPESSYLHLHFDSASGKERDLYVDMRDLDNSRGVVWVKRVEGPMPEGAELEALIENMPEGGIIYATEGGVIYLTKDDTDKLYVALTGDQDISGVKTFAASPVMPTPDADDKSGRAATTEFVARALASMDDVVRLMGDQAIAGVKTFAASPVVPTPDAADKSGKAASTEFVAQAIAAAHEDDDTVVRTEGNQDIAGVKTFADSPKVPTAPEGTNDLTAASTQFVTGAIARAHASAPTLVRTAGDQSIDGVKTFLKSAIMPTPPAGDNSGKVATTEFVQDAISGFEAPEKWIKRVEGSVPTGETLEAMLEDMPIGGVIYYTDGGEAIVVLTQAAADDRYVRLVGNQIVSGEITFENSPRVPTTDVTDSSTRVASTAFVQAVVASVESQGGGVALAGDQSIAGVKTFTSSPVVPTPDTGDNSTKAANTAYVQSALAGLSASSVNAVALSGNQSIGGVKSFTDNPTVPTLDATDNSTKVANTAYVQSVIGAMDIPAPGVELTGNQTISGVKTFTSSPIAPTPVIGDDSTKVATTEFVLNTVPFKVIDGPLPEDISSLVVDMPFGGVIIYSE